jgi:hypothetical protein
MFEILFFREEFELTLSSALILSEDCYFLFLCFLMSLMTYLARENFLANMAILEDISSCLNDSIGDAGTTSEHLSYSTKIP